jgi:transposase
MSKLLSKISIEYGILEPQETPEAYHMALLKEKEARSVTFVSGRGKRKTQLQRDMEQLETFMAQKAKYADYNATFNGRNSFSKTDTDATFMRMKEDHMKNGQLKPGYNLQLGVEGEYIVGVNISSDRSDQGTLLDLLDRMEKGYGRRHENVVADAGYESEENYLGLKERGQAAFIKPQNYEKSKARKYRTNAYLRENMPYDPDTDTYTCPAGHTFEPIYETKRKSKRGFEAVISVYECGACEGCPHKKLCTRAKGNRQLQVSKQFVALRQAALDRITSPKGKLLRLNRSIQSEGAFGVLKQDYGFRRFLRRGMENVLTETFLYAIAYNIDKLYHKLMRNLCGCTLHMFSSA